MGKDYYSILQVAPNAEQEVIDAAYRRLAQKYHPDHNPSPDAAERMKAINEAYDVLSDPSKRARYDLTRRTPPETRPAQSSNSQTSQSPSPSSSSSRSPRSDRESSAKNFHSLSNCDSCGRVAPTKKISLYQNTGLIILRFERHVKGNLCRDCINKYFWELTIKTFLFGWWGVISMLVTPIAIVNNIIQYLSARSLPLSFEDAAIDSRGSSRQSGRSGIGTIGYVFIGLAVLLGIYISISLIQGNSATERVQNSQIVSSIAQATPIAVVASQPTQTAVVFEIRSDIPTQILPTEPSGIFGSMTPISPHDMFVCVETANIRSGPGVQYPVIRQTTNAWSWRVYGKIGEWYYIGYNEQHVDEFMHQSTLCEQTVPGVAVTTSAPTAQAANQNDFIRLVRREFQVCVPYAAIRQGPGANFPVKDYIAKDGSWSITGKSGTWYYGYINTKDKVTDGYLQSSDLCDPDPGLTIPCDDYIYQKWRNRQSTKYAPPCTATQ